MQRFGIKQEDVGAARRRVGPDEWQAGPSAIDAPSVHAHLAHQQSTFSEMGAGLIDDPAHDIKAIFPAGKSQGGFTREFRWQGTQVGGIHVGWIAEDQIEGAERYALEQVGANHFRASGEAQGSGVAPRKAGGAGVGID